MDLSAEWCGEEYVLLKANMCHMLQNVVFSYLSLLQARPAKSHDMAYSVVGSGGLHVSCIFSTQL